MTTHHSPQPSRRTFLAASASAVAAQAALAPDAVHADADFAAPEGDDVTRAFINGEGHGWRSLGAEDFERVNSHDDTWTWDGNSVHCTGEPLSVTKSVKKYRNFELVCQWRHRQPGGNSGIFAWVSQESLDALDGPGLPHGIEVQMLDPQFTEKFKQSNPDRSTDWFTTHGDVFPVGESTMELFPPLSPNGARSFPTKELTRGANEWNHYYVRAINGELRLWVNGEEVSGGTNAQPAEGYICLESEGAPIDFKNLRIRELP